jgi:hypothetical protein
VLGRDARNTTAVTRSIEGASGNAIAVVADVARPRPCRQITGGTTRGPAGVDELACFMDRGREFGYG